MSRKRASLIAHELGHVVSAPIFDKNWRVLEMVLEYDAESGNLAHVMFENDGEEHQVFNGQYSRMKNVSSLGGIFGELAYDYCVNGWGCWYDVVDFLSANRLSKSKLYTELYKWFYIDRDLLSFSEVAKQVLSHRGGRFLKPIDVFDFQKRLPHTSRVFDAFTSAIDVHAFRDEVNELASSKITKIGKKELDKISSRIIRGYYHD